MKIKLAYDSPEGIQRHFAEVIGKKADHARFLAGGAATKFKADALRAEATAYDDAVIYIESLEFVYVPAKNAEVALLLAVIEYAKREIVGLTESGVQRIKDFGGDVDPPERTYEPIINAINALIRKGEPEAQLPLAFNDNSKEG